MMRSDSLIRFEQDDPPRHYASEERREAIQADVERFLKCGGQIKKMPNNFGRNPTYKFNFGDKGLS